VVGYDLSCSVRRGGDDERHARLEDAAHAATGGTSPGSVTPDRYDKPAEYAAAGIDHHWRFERLTVFRYRLDPATGRYASAGADTDKMPISSPFELQLDFSRLRRGGRTRR
jgi:hypothetical protein